MKKFDARLKWGCVARSGVELMKMILEADKKGITGSALGGKGVSSATDSYFDIWAMESSHSL
jgi:hypothetical protein